MPQVHFVQKARKPIKDSGIKKGESYFWWKFRRGGKQVSKTRPKQSQLTQSEYLGTLYSMQEYAEEWSPVLEEIRDQIEDIKGQLEELRDAQDEKLNNMPEQLQQSSTGELLQERYDSLEAAISELEGVETSEDEEESEEAPGERAQEIWTQVTDILGNIS